MAVVSEKCEPNQRTSGTPAPCQRVDLENGYALLKDLNGPLQYLLIPLAKITGMESPALLDPVTPNFFAFTWQSRTQLAIHRGLPIGDSALSLAINAKYGRTQNQLHIHISCLCPDVRYTLDRRSHVLQPLADGKAAPAHLPATHLRCRNCRGEACLSA